MKEHKLQAIVGFGKKINIHIKPAECVQLTKM
jgi:hypothetical protein